MTRQFADEKRRYLAETLRYASQDWGRTAGDTGFQSPSYFELFTEIWLRQGEAVSKTDCYRFMRDVSPQTAKKYVRRAISNGYLTEQDNPHDRRAKLITMSSGTKDLLEQSFDRTADRLRGMLQPQRHNMHGS